MSTTLLLLQITAMMPDAILAGLQVAEIVTRVRDILQTGREPTDEDRAFLNAQLKTLQDELNKDPPIAAV